MIPLIAFMYLCYFISTVIKLILEYISECKDNYDIRKGKYTDFSKWEIK